MTDLNDTMELALQQLAVSIQSLNDATKSVEAMTTALRNERLQRNPLSLVVNNDERKSKSPG